jgi:hypothetical protein
MQSLPKPIDVPVDVYRMCVQKVKNSKLRLRLRKLEPVVVKSALEFEKAGASGTFYTVKRRINRLGTVVPKQMSDLYTLRMVRANMPARAVYDRLITAPSFGRCPLCDCRDVTTLDHFLPKAHYPSLAVNPLNLIPACHECNKAKLDCIPVMPEDQTLHPYFDDVNGSVWLKATVVGSVPAAVNFSPVPPSSWDPLTRKRLKKHFEQFGLAALFATKAAEEMVNIRLSLETLHKASGMKAVRLHLEDAYLSRKSASRNSWQSALYSAMARSDWFCDGGFR